MLKFRIDVRVRESVRAKCTKHPDYDPSADPKLNYGPGCSACTDIRNLQAARLHLEEAAKSFERRAYQWKVSNLPRLAKRNRGSTNESELPSGE